MKLRTDFVSNSSSTSFVVAVNKEYETSAFIKDLAEACASPEFEYHDKNLIDRNKRILDFCLNTYELAFLGEWKLKTEEIIKTKDEYCKKFIHDDMDEEDRKEMLAEGERYWQQRLKDIEKASRPDCDPNFKKLVGKDYLDEEGKLHMFQDDIAYNCIIDSDTMHHELARSGYEDLDNSKQRTEYRIEMLRELAECKSSFKPNVKCYAITLNTIKNTRDLLNSGAELEFEKYEDLDKLEKMLNEGKKIYSIRINNSGDGYSNYAIYCERNADGMKKVAVTCLNAEYM